MRIYGFQATLTFPVLLVGYFAVQCFRFGHKCEEYGQIVSGAMRSHARKGGQVVKREKICRIGPEYTLTGHSVGCPRSQKSTGRGIYSLLPVPDVCQGSSWLAVEGGLVGPPAGGNRIVRSDSRRHSLLGRARFW